MVAENEPRQSLPYDLVMADIIPRLPMKTIGRFRCVSKPYRSLLTSPEFLKSHLELHEGYSESLLYTVWHNDDIHAVDFGNGGGGDGASETVFHLHDPKRRVPQLGASCHGLVLIVMKGLQDHIKVLMNPVTREAVDLPHGPSASSCAYGLGYDNDGDDYKVVSLSIEQSVYVYSVRRKTWRRLEDLRYHFVSDSPGVFVDGCIFWIAGDLKATENPVHVLVAFKVASEEFEVMQLPGEFDGELGFGLTVLEGLLGLWFRTGPEVDVWVLNEFGVDDSWTNIAYIDCPSSGFEYAGYSVVCLLNEEEFLLNWYDRRFYAYSWRSEDWRLLDIDGLPWQFWKLMPFRGSLMSPNLREE